MAWKCAMYLSVETKLHCNVPTYITVVHFYWAFKTYDCQMFTHNYTFLSQFDVSDLTGCQ